jgi:hypothetical protein
VHHFSSPTDAVSRRISRVGGCRHMNNPIWADSRSSTEEPIFFANRSCYLVSILKEHPPHRAFAHLRSISRAAPNEKLTAFTQKLSASTIEMVASRTGPSSPCLIGAMGADFTSWALWVR